MQDEQYFDVPAVTCQLVVPQRSKQLTTVKSKYDKFISMSALINRRSSHSVGINVDT